MIPIQTFLGPNGLIYSTEDTLGNVNILWGGVSYFSFNRNELFSKLLGMAQLDSINVLHETICEIFKVSRNTITNVSNIYRKDGIAGLLNYRHGAPGVEEELKSFIIKMYIDKGKSHGYQKRILEAVKEKVEEGEFRKGISRTTLHNIVREYEKEREEQKRKNIEDRKAEEKARENKKLKEVGEDCVKTGGSGGDEQLDFVEDLTEGEERCVDHGGCGLVVPLLDKYGLADQIPADENGARFSNTELAITYAMLNAGEIAKVEQDFKLLPSYEMGGMIGRIKLPSLSLYRKRMPLVVAQMDMRDVILETSKSMHELLSFSYVVYIDGHFMVYHGDSDTLHGYNPQKRLAMHGREYFFVHDRDGLPVYATMSDGYRKSKHYIEDVDEKLRDIYGVRKKELLAVFDRGGYSKEFCVEIADTIRFICWRSDARSVPEEATTAEWTEVRAEHQGNNYGQVDEKTLFGWEREAVFELEGKKAAFREIWIRKGRKTSPALSNDLKTSLEDLVRHMTHRWGAQENMFKELKDHGIDRIHSYGKEDFTESFLYEQGLEEIEDGIIREIDNPERKKIDTKLAKLRVKRNKVSEQILKLQKEGPSRKLAGLKRKYSGLERQINNQIKKRDTMPKKVNLFDRIKEKGIVRLSDEKKLFFDWLKMNAIWAKREMIEIAKPIYGDLRDVNKFMKAILKSRTYVKRDGETLHVSFPPQQSQKGSQALEKLCASFNNCGNLNSGLNFKRMIFGVREKH
jgi:hypothetical protein